jgi:rod shape determining protein RodA
MVRERGPLTYVNISLLALVAGLVVYGSIMVQSATSGMAGGSGLFKRHLFGVAVGLVLLGIAWAIDYRAYRGWVGPLLMLDAFLIIAPRIPGLGDAAKGATSWLQIGGLRLFQPSEPAKLITIIVMAATIAQLKGVIAKPSEVGRILAILAVPLGLILLQPDLGTGLVFVALTLGMLLVGGMRTRYFVIMAVVGAVLVGAVFQLHLLKQYQEDRLLVFVDPTRDPRGAGYNLEQSKIAIGSGEISGKGLGSGTQSNLNFLPERHTDFIFSVLGEELGFTGALILLGLYLALLVVALNIAASSKDLFGSLIVAGVMSMWLFQILENIGMTIGLMPITGIPLPFMSFGSSMMVTNLAATGMLLSVWSRRFSS